MTKTRWRRKGQQLAVQLLVVPRVALAISAPAKEIAKAKLMVLVPKRRAGVEEGLESGEAERGQPTCA
jgi:hypothetical protein